MFGLSVQRFPFLDKEHFVYQAFKFAPTFLKNGKLFPKIFVLLIVGVRVAQVFSNSRVFVFFNSLEKLSTSVANINPYHTSHLKL